MNDTTFLLSHIHPCFEQDGHPSSQAFRPAPKEEQKLSVYNGDLISPVDAWDPYTKDLKLRSSGALALSMAEYGSLELPVPPDPDPFPEHVLIDLSTPSKSATEKKAKLPKAKTEPRGWLYKEIMI